MGGYKTLYPPVFYDFCVGVPISRLLTVGCLKCESGSSRFHPGEGPSRGLLRD